MSQTITELRSKSKEELVTYAIELFPTKESAELEKMTKKALLEEIGALQMTEMVEGAVPVVQPVETLTKPAESVSAPVEVSTPTPGDFEWTKYLLSLLDKKELEGDKPTNAGLRRLFRKLGWELISQELNVLKCPTMDDPQRASVVCTMRYLYQNNGPYTVQDAADCSAINNQEPYCNHPLATASTIAESRCFRKILGLSVLASDETKSPTQPQLETARTLDSVALPRSNDAQRNAIKSTASRLGIDLNKLLINTASVKNKSLETISIEEGQALMRICGQYDRKEIAIPTEIIAD